MISDWIKSLFNHEAEYTDEDRRQAENAKNQAEQSIRQSQQQVSEIREIRKESEPVNRAMRMLNSENNFAAVIRRNFVEGIR